LHHCLGHGGDCLVLLGLSGSGVGCFRDST
jgi:hypothetical protein